MKVTIRLDRSIKSSPVAGFRPFLALFVLQLKFTKTGDGDVLSSYYLGFFCPNCGPYSRESGYFPTREAAKEALNSGCYGR